MSWRRLLPFFAVLVIAVGAVFASGPAAAASDEPSAAEVSFWDTVKDTSDPEELQLYLDEYPEGHFAPLARLKLKKMGAEPEEEPDRPWLGLDQYEPVVVDPDATSIRVEGVTDLTGRGVLSGSEVPKAGGHGRRPGQYPNL